MKQAIIALLCFLAGLGIGGGGVYAYALQNGLAEKDSKPKPGSPGETETLPPFKVRAPMIYEDGSLATYAVFKVQLVVNAEEAEKAETAQSLLINAINMRTFKTPLLKGANSQIPSIEDFRKVVNEAGTEALGPNVVSNVLITDVQPDQTGPLD